MAQPLAADKNPTTMTTTTTTTTTTTHEKKESAPTTVVIPAKLLRKMWFTVATIKNEAGGELVVNKTDDRWDVCEIKQVFGGTNYVDYERNLDVQFHTHPMSSTLLCEDGGYPFSVPSPYDIILLTLADAYTSGCGGGKLGVVFTTDAVYTMEVEKFLFTGTTDAELHEYLKFAFYDLFNWCGAQRVAGHSIFTDLPCVNDYMSYARSTHGVKVCRYEWPHHNSDINLKTCGNTWLPAKGRGKFEVWSDLERRKVSASFSPTKGYLMDGWVPDKRFHKIVS